MKKPKRLQDQKYFLENIIEAITFWFNTNKGGKTPTAVGAIVQRWAGMYLGTTHGLTGYAGGMDDLREKAQKQLKEVEEKIKMENLKAEIEKLEKAAIDALFTPGMVPNPLLGGPFVIPSIPILTQAEVRKARKEELEAMTKLEVDRIYRKAQKAEVKKDRIRYILEAEKDYGETGAKKKEDYDVVF